MSRLPVVGDDDDIWGDLLNDFLKVEHEKDGTLRLRNDGTFYTLPGGGIPGSDLAGDVQLALSQASTAVQPDVLATKAGLNQANTFTGRMVINEPGAGAATLQLPDTSASTGITFGGDTNIFRSGAGQLQTASAFFAVRATLGVAALAATQSGDATRRFQVNTDGKVLWSVGSGIQDTTMMRDSAGGLKIGQSTGTLASPATPTLSLVPTGVTSGSPTGGGTFLINQGTNAGSALNVYSTAGTGALGRLVNITAAGATFDKPAMHVDYAGTANAAEISSTGTGTTGNALNVVSTNPNDSTVGINGSEISRGTLKIVHNYPGQADPNASALSLRANGVGTAAQGIFFDAENGGTTGNLMKFRQNGVDQFIMSPNGSLLTSANVQIGSVTSDVGGGTGVLGLRQASVVPTTNPATGSVVIYADQGVLKWRDPNGNVYAATGGLTSSPDFLPSDQSYLGWAYDPTIAANNTAPTAGQPVIIKVRAAQNGTVANICLNVNTLGSGFTANASFVAIYDMSGTRLGVSNDLATTLNTTGAKTIPLTSSVSITGGTFYYIYIVANATTMPALNRGANVGVLNQNLGPGTYRFATIGSGITSPPASITLSGSAALSTSYWVALA